MGEGDCRGRPAGVPDTGVLADSVGSRSSSGLENALDHVRNPTARAALEANLAEHVSITALPCPQRAIVADAHIGKDGEIESYDIVRPNTPVAPYSLADGTVSIASTSATSAGVIVVVDQDTGGIYRAQR